MWKRFLEEYGYIEKNYNQYLSIFIHIPKCAGGTITRHIVSKYSRDRYLDPYNERQAILKLTSLGDVDIDKELRENPYLLKRSWIAEYVGSLGYRRREAIHSIIGHQVYYGIHELFEKPARYFTFLREPFSRFVSFYNYMSTVRVTSQRLKESGIIDEHDNIRSLDVWLEQADLAGNTMTSFLAQMYCGEDLLPNKYTFSTQDLVNAKKMLGAMYFVGLTENDNDVQFAYNRMGINFYKPDRNVLRIKSTYVLPSNMEAARELILSKYPYEQELYEYAVQLNQEMKSRIKDFEKAVSYTHFRRNISKRVNIVLQAGGLYKAFSDKARRLLGKISPAK